MRALKLRSVAIVVLGALLAGACGGEPATTAGEGPVGDAGSDETAGDGLVCQTVSVALLDEDSHRLMLHPIESGIVESEVIGDVQLDFLQIPGLIQATGTEQYDVVQTSLVGFARARDAGADLRLIAPALVQQDQGATVVVRADSGIEEPSDLAGRIFGVPSLGSTAATIMRLVLIEGFGIDAVLEGGDIQFVELAPAQLVGALSQGDVDAALLYHRAGYEARENPDFRVLFNIEEEYTAITGTQPISSGFVTLASQLEEKRACLLEFRRMLGESVAYVKDNTEETAETVAAETDSDPLFLADWVNNQYDFAGTVEPQYLEMVDAIWNLAFENGEIPSLPDMEEVLAGEA